MAMGAVAVDDASGGKGAQSAGGVLDGTAVANKLDDTNFRDIAEVARAQDDHAGEEQLVPPKRMVIPRLKKYASKDEDKKKQATAKNLQTWVQCDNPECSKWRRVSVEIAKRIEDDTRWQCKDNPDKAFASCSAPQQLTDAEINDQLGISSTSESDIGSDSEEEASKPVVWHAVTQNLFMHRQRKKLTRDEFQRRTYANVDKGRCGAKGFGVIAQDVIRRGSFILEYCGEVINEALFKERTTEYAERGIRHHYFMTLGTNEVIDATMKANIARFMNHSCDPNCETQKWEVCGELSVGFFAIKNIKKGEELTFDYKFERCGFSAQVCHCGAANCRGMIGVANVSDTATIDLADYDFSQDPEPIMLTDGSDANDKVRELVRHTSKRRGRRDDGSNQPAVTRPTLAVRRVGVFGNQRYSSEVERQLDDLLAGRNGVCNKEEMIAVLRLFKLAMADSIDTDGTRVFSARDLSLLLDAIMKCNSYNARKYFIDKNGVAVLQTVTQKLAHSYKKTTKPVLRKIFQVLDHVAVTKEDLQQVHTGSGSFATTLNDLLEYPEPVVKTKAEHYLVNVMEVAPQPTLRSGMNGTNTTSDRSDRQHAAQPSGRTWSPKRPEHANANGSPWTARGWSPQVCGRSSRHSSDSPPPRTTQRSSSSSPRRSSPSRDMQPVRKRMTGWDVLPSDSLAGRAVASAAATPSGHRFAPTSAADASASTSSPSDAFAVRRQSRWDRTGPHGFHANPQHSGMQPFINSVHARMLAPATSHQVSQQPAPSWHLPPPSNSPPPMPSSSSPPPVPPSSPKANLDAQLLALPPEALNHLQTMRLTEPSPLGVNSQVAIPSAQPEGHDVDMEISTPPPFSAAACEPSSIPDSQPVHRTSSAHAPHTASNGPSNSDASHEASSWSDPYAPEFRQSVVQIVKLAVKKHRHKERHKHLDRKETQKLVHHIAQGVVAKEKARYTQTTVAGNIKPILRERLAPKVDTYVQEYLQRH
eukprot:jgi/Chlat1/7032/Chrsp56S06703